MDHQLPGPSKIRKRATKACLACRARKVRCDVSQRGRPCMNCYLDGESCVVIGRASRRRKSKDDGSGNAAADDGSSGHLHGRDSAEPEPAPGQPADADVLLMDTPPSDGGSERPEVLRDPGHAFPSGRPAFQGRESSFHGMSTQTQYAPQHSSDRARLLQLQWAGEQAMTFGSDVTYTYYPFLTLDNLSNVLPQDVSYLEMQGCFRVPARTILDEFVKQYFLHVHPITALLNESDVWEMYGSPSGVAPESGHLSLLVWQAMLFAACNYVPRSTLRALGFADTKTARAAFYRRAKLLFDFEAESSHVPIAQAALLLSSWDPSPARSRARAGSSWLGVAVEQARLAGAHRTAWLTDVAAPGRRHHELALKRRLWWCVVLHDRISSLCSREPLRVTRAHCDFDVREDPIGPGAMAGERNGSKVYNIETKTSLLGGVFPELLRLAVALTDLLAVVHAPDELPRWDKRHRQEDVEKVKECKAQMRSWYRAASAKSRPPGSRAARRDDNGGRPEEFTHDSVVLYTDLMYLLYHSAMTKLCHFECFELIRARRGMDPDGASVPDKTMMTENHRDIQHAAFGVVTCLRDLAHRRLLRWLPSTLIGCISLPLVLSVIDVKLSPQPGLELHDLRQLDELARGYQPHQDMTDWTSDAIRQVLDLARLDVDAHRTAADGAGPDAGAPEASHPSVHLRLALSLDPSIAGDAGGGGGGGGGGDPGARELSASIQRLLATDGLRRTRSALEQSRRRRRGAGRRSSPAGVGVGAGAGAEAEAEAGPGHRALGRPPALAAHDESIQLRMAEWMQQDQAISYGVQLGIVPPDLPAGEEGTRRALAGGPGGGGGGDGTRAGDEGAAAAADAAAREVESARAEADWEATVARAFSEAGDRAEGRVLDAFAFRDRPPGAGGPGQLELAAQAEEDGAGDPGGRGQAEEDDGYGEMARDVWSAATGARLG